MRLFIALTLPNETKEYLLGIQKKISNTYAKIAWEPKKKLHITLVFLGTISERELQPLRQRLRAIHHAPITTTLSPLGGFPTLTAPRVLWAGIHPPDAIIRLQLLVDQETLTLSKKDYQTFTPHLTLGRVKLIKNKEKFLQRLKTIHIEPKSFTCTTFALIKSTPTHNGSVYELIEEYPLQ